MATWSLVDLGLEVVVEAVVVVEEIEGVTEMIATGVDVTEEIVIQMIGRSAVKTIAPMDSEMTETVVTTGADVVDEDVVMIEDPVTTTETVSVRTVRTRTGMK
jgi:hypothetical protein